MKMSFSKLWKFSVISQKSIVMKKLFLIILLISAAFQLKAGDVEFYLDLCRFQNAADQPYIEVYMSIDATSVDFQQVKNKGFQANVNIRMQLKKISGTDTLITYADNYNLLSQFIPDTTAEHTRQAFVEMKRIQLESGEGDYLLEVIMKDKQDEEGLAIVNYYSFEIEKPVEGFAFSDLEFVHSIEKVEEENILTKNGYQIIPFGMNATFVDQDHLGFYVELYHADQLFQDKYFAQASILQGGQALLMYDLMRQKEAAPMDVFSGHFDISKLPSQTYQLQIKIFDPQNPEGESFTKAFFVANSRIEPRLAEYTAQTPGAELFSEYSDDQLTDYIETLIHISTENEIRFAKALTEKEDKQNFLYAFWQKRLSQDKTVEQLWRGHLAALDYVNEQFKSNFREGWQTDRGRVFLKYGIPSDIELYPSESSRLPHEIWKYDRLGAQSQIIFVFLDNDLGSGEYVLIHSNKYGELQNFGWQGMLRNGDTPFPNQEFQRDTYEGNRQLRDIDP